MEAGELVAGQDQVASSRIITPRRHGVAQGPGDGDARCEAGSAPTRSRGETGSSSRSSTARATSSCSPVDAPREPAPDEPPDADVLAHGQVVEQAEVLVDHGHARGAGGRHWTGSEPLPVHGETHPGSGAW